ncbi:MAG TPA: extracellular solute-binding protein, partial [Rhodothermales bacterium]|nr:extracellular solute-binding protein [Rhodothermales bacterium]
SLPMEATNLGLLYNKDQFREVGLDPDHPPETWQELIDYTNRLKVDENGDGRYERIGFLVPVSPASGPLGPWMMWQFMPFVWQAGGNMINLDQTQVLFAQEPGVEALTLWKNLYQSQNLRDFTTTDAITVFASKQASMILDGPWNLPRYPEVMRGTDWGVAPLPAGPAGHATIVGGEYLSIFKQSEHPDAAWTFVKWITSPEIQAFWSMKSNYLPIRKDVLQIPEYRQYLDENPNLKAFVEEMDYARAQRHIDFYTLEITREVAQAIEQSTVGTRTPEAALKDAAAASNQMLARAQREQPVASK